MGIFYKNRFTIRTIRTVRTVYESYESYECLNGSGFLSVNKKRGCTRSRMQPFLKSTEKINFRKHSGFANHIRQSGLKQYRK
jgi:hypothetical protein